MLSRIINYSINNKVIILLLVIVLIGTGSYSLYHIPIGAVPDVTNNQVQVITTSRDLSTQEVERYLTYPVELEMANLPGVQEIRSISKFGLSVVTIVFDDNMGTYLPRQLIAERLKAVEAQIPEGFGTPFMGPISTGLGEIYQYILDVKPAYAGQYSVAELRTIQDWIVKRQLSGISGVVEVNTWGGFLKTYEVAIDPNRLQAMDISMMDVYEALQNNNSVTGGGYIEKTYEAYFIRAEGLVGSIEDIENIVVKNTNGNPVFIKDLATVGFGAATRFGAITGNGEGEKILGQVMMLKGADSKKVIDNVIERVANIQNSLPPGVFINPFLERSDLINRTTNTIAENLILGFLIVLFVVIVFLGNIRSGLVVASVIPLTLFFALTAMYVFGVDANLMSLGAIDFGIIIDGAVIIIEYIVFSLTQQRQGIEALQGKERQLYTDTIVKKGATKMMRSAVFGQIIIIIVFIPVLALSGIEGKMFRPMALTFCFALIGAMVLCFTYVPVMATLFLKPKTTTNRHISTQLINGIKRIYQPLLKTALQLKAVTLVFAMLLFIGTAFIFNRMGGEFIPTLDEGDFVIQPVLKVGMSLAATVEMTTRIEQIVMRFPEVKQVVSRIGAAEVPTDPMSMEESDVIITLKEKSKWTTAASKDGLADAFKAALLEEIPGIEIEFTQPIEMRFNELISGVSSDLAIKIFGEDLDILYQKATEIEKLIKEIDGIGDISVEKIDGLPQMSVRYDRAKIAQYGINISALNELIAMGFAGKSAGIIFEGERQFDIVIRYDKAYRNDLNSLANTLIDLPNGQKLPLSVFAAIEYSTGPAMISRDDTKRRVVVGINVRNRDLQSVVDEVRERIAQKMTFPSGYTITYGGQFENLQLATQRLLVAVPIALILIFILLYFAFSSIKEALLIFSAIPLATIGGVLSLYVRGLPFSISAGVGFIALFGIAVLNGIVMIEHVKELRKERPSEDLSTIIIQGALDRIRAVLLTAFAAALGFLPMAISTSAGAEVQRPLATVVIGGLLSATLLTLIVLPVLYSLFTTAPKKKIGLSSLLIFVCLGIPSLVSSQQLLTLQEATTIALENNLAIEVNRLEVKKEQTLVSAVKEIPKTEFFYEYDRNNIASNNKPLHVFGIGQSFKWLGVNKAAQNLQQYQVKRNQQYENVLNCQVAQRVHYLYNDLHYHQARLSVYQQIDSIYTSYKVATNKKFDLGESTIIEKLTATQKQEELSFWSKEIEAAYQNAYLQLKLTMKYKEPFKIPSKPYVQLSDNISEINSHPIRQYQKTILELAQQTARTNEKQTAPEWNVALFNGWNSFNNTVLYPGIQAGIALPLHKKQYKAQQEADQISISIEEVQLENTTVQLEHLLASLQLNLQSSSEKLALYKTSIRSPALQLQQYSERALALGEIDYFEYLQILENHRKVKIQELDLIYEYNQIIIALTYLLN